MNVMKLSQASSCIMQLQGKYTSVSNAISVLIIAFQLPYAVGTQRENHFISCHEGFKLHKLNV